mmetsp:Transcript_10516/g.34457  ORF Transcript_10516/g.34457 Transcript_10516/m.34457 type:complete len:286 (+) Transcript_10516:1141-1998(+)
MRVQAASSPSKAASPLAERSAACHATPATPAAAPPSPTSSRNSANASRGARPGKLAQRLSSVTGSARRSESERGGASCSSTRVSMCVAVRRCFAAPPAAGEGTSLGNVSSAAVAQTAAKCAWRRSRPRRAGRALMSSMGKWLSRSAPPPSPPPSPPLPPPPPSPCSCSGGSAHRCVCNALPHGSSTRLLATGPAPQSKEKKLASHTAAGPPPPPPLAEAAEAAEGEAEEASRRRSRAVAQSSGSGGSIRSSQGGPPEGAASAGAASSATVRERAAAACSGLCGGR